MWLLLKVREMCLPLLFLLWLCLETHTQTIKREGWGNIFLWPLSVFTACLNICEHFPVPLLLTSLTQRPARQFLSVQEEAYGKLIPSASLVLLWLMYQCGFFVFFWLNDPMSVQSNKVHSWPFWCPSSFQRKDLSGKLVLLQADFVSDLVEFWF